MDSWVAEKCPQCGANLPSGRELVICRFCGSRLIRLPQDSPGPAGAGSTHYIHGIRLKPFSYVDNQGMGMEALSLLVPSGWEFQGGVHWLMNNPGMPAVLAFRVYNPVGEEAFELLPTLSFFWTTDPMARMSFPRGSHYYGNEVQPPCSALQALRDIVVPRYRGQAGQVQVVAQESLPELPGQLRALNPGAPTGNMAAEGAKIRIRYPRGGKTIEEELLGVVQIQRMGAPSFMGMCENVLWTVDYLFSFQALSGRHENLADLFQTMLFSLRLNPQWFARYLQISQYMIQNQIQHIHQIGQISRMISQTSNQISDRMMDAYYQRQATMDRLSQGFSQSIRGVDEYYNPFEDRGVELPGGYNHAWANTLGEYIVTDDPNFNPNIGSNLNWEPLQRH